MDDMKSSKPRPRPRSLRPAARATPRLSRHKQVTVDFGEIEALVDFRIAHFVLDLWIAGIGTIASCQSFGGTGLVWIVFADHRSAQKFSLSGSASSSWPVVERGRIRRQDVTAAIDHSCDHMLGKTIYWCLFPFAQLGYVRRLVRASGASDLTAGGDGISSREMP